MRYKDLFEEVDKNINDELIPLFIIMREKNINSLDLDNLFNYFSNSYNIGDKKEFIDFLIKDMKNYVEKINDNNIILKNNITSSKEYINSAASDKEKENKKVSLLAAKTALKKIREKN